MNCYRIALPSETSLSIAENAPLVPYVPNQDEELTAVLMSATLALEVTYRWSCFAENDGGIDASSEEVETKPLLPQNFVFDRGIPAGYLFQSHVLSLTEKNPVLLEENDDFEYVPCWGTVSDSYSYRLCTIPDKEHLLLRDKSLLRYEAGCLIEQGELIATCGNFSGEVRLPDGITAIAKGIFCDNKTLESVILPEGLVSIKDEAFKGCTALEKVTFPSTLTSIGSWAFYHCDRLTTLALPETLDEIGSCAFARNPALTDITLPDSLTVIPYALFVGCTALTSLTLPEGLCKIDRNAFEDCTALKVLVIPDTVTTIGTYAFKNCTALERVTLSASLETLYDYAFENCVALKAITTPPTLGEISFATFRGCSALSKVTLSEGLTTVNSLAFDRCSSLTELALPSTLKKLGAYPFKETAITSLTLPDGLTSLDFALLGGTKIETFTVQKALAEHLMQYYLHNAAFLKTLIFAEGVTVIHHPDEFRVRYGNEDVRFPAGIAKTLKTVETIVLPGTLTDFDPMLLLDAPALKTVRIAKGFEKLTPEILPEGITLILEGTNADWSALDEALIHTLKEKNITLVFSDETV